MSNYKPELYHKICYLLAILFMLNFVSLLFVTKKKKTETKNVFRMISGWGSLTATRGSLVLFAMHYWNNWFRHVHFYLKVVPDYTIFVSLFVLLQWVVLFLTMIFVCCY